LKLAEETSDQLVRLVAVLKSTNGNSAEVNLVPIFDKGIEEHNDEYLCSGESCLSKEDYKALALNGEYELSTEAISAQMLDFESLTTEEELKNADSVGHITKGGVDIGTVLSLLGVGMVVVALVGSMYYKHKGGFGGDSGNLELDFEQDYLDSDKKRL
jgi:hypothetical protein